MVNNEAIIHALQSINEAVEDRVILAAGKMHAAGGSEIISMDDIHDFSEAGADNILMPAPGTVPGISQEWCAERISYIHKLGKLAITSIGTSQEGADVETICRIALMAKMAGTDLHHIGDSGSTGLRIRKISWHIPLQSEKRGIRSIVWLLLLTGELYIRTPDSI